MENPFAGRPNEAVLEKKRDEYIEQAVAEMDSDGKFVAEIDDLINAGERTESIEKVIACIEDIILEHHYADKDTSEEKRDAILEEYPEDIINARAEKWEMERAKVLGVQDIL